MYGALVLKKMTIQKLIHLTRTRDKLLSDLKKGSLTKSFKVGLFYSFAIVRHFHKLCSTILQPYFCNMHQIDTIYG